MATISLMCSILRVSWSCSSCSSAFFGPQLVGQLDDEAGDEFALGIGGEEAGEVGLVLLEEAAELDEAGHFRAAQLLADEGGGDVDAVEDVADVVEDAGGDLGHAGLARGIHQLLVQLVQLRGGELLRGDPGKRTMAGCGDCNWWRWSRRSVRSRAGSDRWVERGRRWRSGPRIAGNRRWIGIRDVDVAVGQSRRSGQPAGSVWEGGEPFYGTMAGPWCTRVGPGQQGGARCHSQYCECLCNSATIRCLAHPGAVARVQPALSVCRGGVFSDVPRESLLHESRNRHR